MDLSRFLPPFSSSVFFLDVPAATAILDRFLHNAEVIAITGRSYRLRNRPAKDPTAAVNEEMVTVEAKA